MEEEYYLAKDVLAKEVNDLKNTLFEEELSSIHKKLVTKLADDYVSTNTELLFFEYTLNTNNDEIRQRIDDYLSSHHIEFQHKYVDKRLYSIYVKKEYME